MTTPDLREIRFNYTSADDRQVVTLLLVLSEIFIHRRNLFLAEELVADPKRKSPPPR